MGAIHVAAAADDDDVEDTKRITATKTAAADRLCKAAVMFLLSSQLNRGLIKRERYPQTGGYT